MWWGAFWLACTILVFTLTWKSKAHRLATVCLFMWTVLEKVIYQYGVVESETSYITLAFILACAVVYRQHPGLFAFLIFSGILTIVWTLYGVVDPYLFKEVKNGIYGLDLLVVWLSYSISLGWLSRWAVLSTLQRSVKKLRR